MKNDKAVKILLVEDDVDFAAIVKEILNTSSEPVFSIEHTSKLSLIPELLSKSDIQLILLDLNIEDSRGLDTLSKVYGIKSHIPIVVMTGSYDETLGIKALKTGAQDYFLKGRIDRVSLIRSIRYALERKKHKDELHLAHAETKNLLAAIPSLLIGLDANNQVKHWNKIAERTLGISKPSVINRSLDECDFKWDKEAVLHGIRECRSKRKPLRLDDIRFMRPDQTEGFLGFTIYPVQNHPEEGIKILIFGADVTERRQLEKHFYQVTKMESLGVLSGGVAHEFRNQLAPALMSARLAKKEIEKGVVSIERISKIIDYLENANRFVNEILAFGKKEEEKKESLELGQVIQDSLELIKPLLPHNIQVELRRSQEEAPIVADKSQIHQVMMNLCANAQYAMRQLGGKINIAVEVVEIKKGNPLINGKIHPGSYVKLSVRDTGDGIDSKILPHIFEPFFTTKPGNEGAGMGLAVIYGIVTKHQGAITVSSEPGCGTIFDLHFPRHLKPASL